MVLRHFASFALLVACATALINCSGRDVCYAESPECDPNTECETVLRFDYSGNLEVYVRNVNITDYVSIVTDRDLLNTMEYFIFVPFAGQRLRALGRVGQMVLFNQQNLTNVVERLGADRFRCIIAANKLNPDFRRTKSFVVARGLFQQFLTVNEGVTMHKVEVEDSNNELEEDFLPVIHKVSASTNDDESFYSTNDNSQASESIEKMREMSQSEDDSKLEQFVAGQTSMVKVRAILKQLDSDDAGDTEVIEKKTRRKHSSHRQKNLKKDTDVSSKKVLQKNSSTSSEELRPSLNSNEQDDDNEMVYLLLTKQQMYDFIDSQSENGDFMPETVSDSTGKTVSGRTMDSDSKSAKRKKFHPRRHLEKGEVSRTWPEVENENVDDSQNTQYKSSNRRHHKFHPEHYAPKTKIGKNASSVAYDNNKDVLNDQETEEQSRQKIVDKDGNEEVYLLMTKRQMYDFIDKHAERQVANPETIRDKNTSLKHALPSSAILILLLLRTLWN